MPHTNVKSRWIDGDLYFYDKAGAEILHFDGANRKVVVPAASLLTFAGQSVVLNLRTRNTIAEVNAGATLLAAIAGYKYRLIDVLGIAIGGNVGTLTTVDVLATQSAGAAKLAAFAQASLTRSTVLRPGVSGCTVLADGASFIQNDVNTAITIGKTGGTGDTATHIDTILSVEVAA